jgi:hypothetical protein
VSDSRPDPTVEWTIAHPDARVSPARIPTAYRERIASYATEHQLSEDILIISYLNHANDPALADSDNLFQSAWAALVGRPGKLSGL